MILRPLPLKSWSWCDLHLAVWISRGRVRVLYRDPANGRIHKHPSGLDTFLQARFVLARWLRDPRRRELQHLDELPCRREGRRRVFYLSDCLWDGRPECNVCRAGKWGAP